MFNTNFPTFKIGAHRSRIILKSVVLILALVITAEISVAAPMQFRIQNRYQIGLNSTDTTFADLDGDGFLDVIAVNGGQENFYPYITILYGTASGEFSEPVSMSSGALIGETIAAGDFNGDGRPEIVLGSWYQNALGVLVNLGNRQFAPIYYTVPPDSVLQSIDLAVADFDGDGANDVVALMGQAGQRLRFFHVAPNGQLTAFATFAYPVLPDNSYGGAMTVGDINGDNRPDVVLADDGPSGNWDIWYVLGQPAGGTLSRTYGFQLTWGVFAIEVSDLDNDGDNDIAGLVGGMQTFRNNGNGTFTSLPRVTPAYPFLPHDLALGDFDADGKKDMAVLIDSVHNKGVMVMIRKGVGDCTFTGENYYAVSSSTSIAPADINRDGKLDLVTASSFLLQTSYPDYDGISNNTIGVLLNDYPNGFRAPVAIPWAPNFIDAGDFNSDGYKDIVSSWATTQSSASSVDIMLNDHMLGFLPEVAYPSAVSLNGMKTGDFNGDGHRDIVSAHKDFVRRLDVYLGNGTGTVASPVANTIPTSILLMNVVDLNMDGKDDVFTIDESLLGHALLGNSDGTFTEGPGSPITLSNYARVQKGDFNRDGKVDLIISRNGGFNLWLGDGTGRLTQSPAAVPALFNATAGDFNGDGILDLAGMTNGDGGEYITGALGTGDGNFQGSFSKRIPNFSFGDTQSMVSGDFDLDGFDDIAMIMKDNTFGNLIIVQSAGSSGSWKDPTFLGVGTAMRTLISSDFNGDGKTDLGFLGDNARGVIYNTTEAASRKSVFDFDGDGKTDIGIFRPIAGASEWWINRSSTGQTLALQFGTSTDRITPADYTGDGKADIAFFRPSSGEWYVLRSEDFSFFALPFGTNGDVPVPGDYDADGKADFAVFRPSSSTWFISQSSGAPTRIEQFGISGDQPVVADYDGDGKADVGVFRQSAGEWWINRSSAGSLAMRFGNSTDKPVQGDYTGDGKADVAVWRPSSGEWFIVRSEDSSFYGFPFGANGDVVSPGDYDGDGKFDATVFRPSSATWFIARSTAGTQIVQFGATGDRPIANAFVP